MRQDFVTTLELQLREAAAREARPGAALRAAPRRFGPALALTAAALIALVLVAGALRGRDTTPTRPAPHVIAHTRLLSAGGTIAPAFGSVWAADTQTGQVLRIDPRTRAVQARIRLGGPAAVNGGAGAVWAVGFGGLAKIDPASNRVVARRPLPGLRAFDVLPGKGAMWLVGGDWIARVDPRTSAVGRTISTSQGGFQAVGAYSDGRSLYVSRADGRLLRFDAGTGRRLSSVRAAAAGPIATVANGSVIVASDTGLVALDPGTGRARWSRDLGATRVNNAVLSGDTLWVQATDRATHRDRLWRLDASTGRVAGALTLPAFGASGMAMVGSQVWIVTPGGDLVVAA